MKITVDLKVNLRTKEVIKEVTDASRKGLVDVVTDIASDAIEGSPWLTGNNRRSIKFEVGPGGAVAKEELSGAIYSTSGYGGYLEVGTHKAGGGWKMAPRPYFKPALDRHLKELPPNIKAHLGRGG